MARLTGLEPATPGVTGRYSNQLSYNRATCDYPKGVYMAASRWLHDPRQVTKAGRRNPIWTKTATDTCAVGVRVRQNRFSDQ